MIRLALAAVLMVSAAHAQELYRCSLQLSNSQAPCNTSGMNACATVQGIYNNEGEEDVTKLAVTVVAGGAEVVTTINATPVQGTIRAGKAGPYHGTTAVPYDTFMSMQRQVQGQPVECFVAAE